MVLRRRLPSWVRALLSTALAGISPACWALTITPTFDSSIIQAANASAIESSITSALSFYDQTFCNPLNVDILFKVSGSLGQQTGSSDIAYQLTRYADYTAALMQAARKEPSNTVLASAVAHLSQGNQANAIETTNAELRALGFAGSMSGFDGTGTFGGSAFDAVVTLNDQTLSFGSPPDGQHYDATMIVQHEVNEVLGAGGAGSSLNDPSYANTVRPLDLYRYSAPGTPSLTASPGATAYFSVDSGVTDLKSFNQVGLGDYGDWASAGHCETDVQAAFACAGIVSAMTLSSPTAMALEAEGYAVAVPEPRSAWWGYAILGGWYILCRRPNVRSGLLRDAGMTPW